MLPTVLVVMTGLPGVGKSTLARARAARLDGVPLRIDTIEDALVRSGVVARAGGWAAAPDAGYQVAYALAEELLGAGRLVVADCVNPFDETRAAWRAVGVRAGVPVLEVEVVCSDEAEHRRRVEQRAAEPADVPRPTWLEVLDRRYDPLSAGPTTLRVDTGAGIEPGLATVLDAVRRVRTSPA